MKRRRKRNLRSQLRRRRLKDHPFRSQRGRYALALITLAIWLVPVLMAELGIPEASPEWLPRDSRSQVDYVSSDHDEAQQTETKRENLKVDDRDKSGTTTRDLQTVPTNSPVYEANLNVPSQDGQKAGLCESGQTRDARLRAERV